MECRICWASLTAYTNGIIDGEWIELTDTRAVEKIDEFKKKREGHEFFIGDSMTSVSMNISEYDDPYELIKFVKRLGNLTETQLEAYDVMVSEVDMDREEALEKAEDWEFDAIEWDGGNIEKAVGRYYAELDGLLDYGERIRSYFDYEKYGRDICINSYVCDHEKTIFVFN